MRELRDKWLIAAESDKVLETSTHPCWMSAAKFVHEASEGKPAQAIDVTSQGERIFVAEVPPKAASETEWARQHKQK